MKKTIQAIFCIALILNIAPLIGVNIKNKQFFHAIEKTDFDAMAQALKEGADINMVLPKEFKGQNLLSYALIKNNFALFLFLLSKGINSNKQDDEGNTPYHLVLLKDNLTGGRMPYIKILYQYNADINLKNNREETPLHMAVRVKDPEVVKFFLEQGADKNTKRYDGKSPLESAFEYGNKEIIKLLQKNSSQENKQEKGEDRTDEGDLLKSIFQEKKKQEDIEKLISEIDVFDFDEESFDDDEWLKNIKKEKEKKEKKIESIPHYKILSEIRKLPQAPKGYPKANLFAADILLETADAFIKLMKERLNNAEWIESTGTKDYLFVRKLILPENSVIEFRGDLHGDVQSLIRWIDSLADKGWFDKNNPFKLIKKDRYLAFLGDYTDRGHYGAEIMYIIMQLFLHNPDKVLIVRGNHEDYNIISVYGFGTELKQKFSFNDEEIKKFADVYEYLPVAMFLGCEHKDGGVDFIQCCHGGMEFGYNSHKLLSDKDNKRLDVYEWLDREIDKKRQKIACERHPDLKELLTKQIDCEAVNNGFQWNDFDFMNQKPLSMPTYKPRRGFNLHQLYTTRLLEDATEKKSKNKVLAVFRAHQHDEETVQHILDYGNGVYKLWNNEGSKNAIKPGFKWVNNWSGQENEPVPLETYSVWTFNVAPRTGTYEKKIARPDSFDYDTVARLGLKSGFENWTLYPRKIPVKS